MNDAPVLSYRILIPASHDGDIPRVVLSLEIAKSGND